MALLGRVCVCVSSSHSMENEISESHTLSQAAALGILLPWARWREERERERKGGREKWKMRIKYLEENAIAPTWQEERETGETICCCRQICNMSEELGQKIAGKLVGVSRKKFL